MIVHFKEQAIIKLLIRLQNVQFQIPEMKKQSKEKVTKFRLFRFETLRFSSNLTRVSLKLGLVILTVFVLWIWKQWNISREVFSQMRMIEESYSF